MSKIAFAWELGANYGHLSRGLPIAQRLSTQGHDVLFAVCDVQIAETLLTPHGFAFIACPRVNSAARRDRSAANYGQILADCGYSSRAVLRAHLNAWVHLWRLIAPCAVVIDHSPTALLAARILAIPAMLVGTGFTIPPDRDPLPSILLRQSISPMKLRESDHLILGNINDVLQSFNHPPLARIADMFSGLPARLTTFAELDHYSDRREATFIGPIASEQSKARMRWSSSRQTKIFVYLRKGVPGLDMLLAALKQADAEVICVIPDAAVSLIEDLQKAGLHVSTDAVELTPLLPQANAVVTYGGAGLAAQALSAGVPLLLMPQFVEQYMSARRIAALGAGIVIDRARSQADFVQALQRIVTEPAYAQAAQALARKFSSFNSAAAIERLANEIAALADQSGLTLTRRAVSQSL